MAEVPAIETSVLVRSFGPTVALNGLDLCVPQGGILGLLGPNGAGKTTAVRVLATLLRPDSGSARVLGADVVAQAADVRRRIGLTGQYAALDNSLTGRANLIMVGRLSRLSRAEARRRAGELLDRFGLTEAAGRAVKTYSGGMRRRLDLAASLIGRPEVLFLDEPTTGLDPGSRAVMWDIIRDLAAEGSTLLLTTQYLEEADALADRIVLIDHGREIAKGTPSELKALVGDLRVDVVAIDSQGFEQLERELSWQGLELQLQPEQRRISIPAPHEVADLNRVAAVVGATKIPVDEIALRRPTLDDAFISLTGHPVEEATPTEEEVAA
jgi:daunorubicin resistance ABC transporter ATP-binding subunit